LPRFEGQSTYRPASSCRSAAWTNWVGRRRPARRSGSPRLTRGCSTMPL